MHSEPLLDSLLYVWPQLEQLETVEPLHAAVPDEQLAVPLIRSHVFCEPRPDLVRDEQLAVQLIRSHVFFEELRYCAFEESALDSLSREILRTTM